MNRRSALHLSGCSTSPGTHNASYVFGRDGVPPLFQNGADLIGTENLVKLIEDTAPELHKDLFLE